MKKSNKQQLNYQQAQEALEEIISNLQSEELPIEDIPSLYAEALEMEKTCREILNQVVQDIKKLDPEGLILNELSLDVS
ncbi:MULTISPECIES: exodeoxyribonuclease VII small subunit [unclassified Synechococcus]|uniref:exodeoxyribonuclease VII small subunit n=1 Tax=unclassified Synechococcus TaxID=2626047 RepID=UPI0020CD5C50|nr:MULTISPECIES: exodeoxyribonuclease VII small subunit [unclassified Synechococcus]MCP9939341.1 exodeoxyribonuclease VII small subunit [Synechococcus sp. Cruz CV12-2-Slac-r]